MTDTEMGVRLLILIVATIIGVAYIIYSSDRYYFNLPTGLIFIMAFPVGFNLLPTINLLF